MKKGSLGIYGIQDRGNYKYPNFVHDHSLTYMESGSVKQMAQLERISRNKFDNTLHHQIHDLLKPARLLQNDNYEVVFTDNVVGRSFISTDGNIRFEANQINELKNGIESGKCWWYDNRVNAYILNHELAHLYSAIPFFGAFKENSLLFQFDGGASLGNFSAWHFKNGELKLLDFGWELKYLSEFFNANALNFSIIGTKRQDQNSLPGKLMGYASFGNYSQEIESWLKDNSYFSDIWSNKSEFFKKAKSDWNINLKSFELRNSFLQDIAASFQHIFTRDLIQKIKNLKDITGAQYLYYSGGSALNIVANTELIKQNLFTDVFIPPCSNDSGLSLGAATALELEKGEEIEKHSPYLNNWGIENYQVQYNSETIKAVAELILQSKVIGISNGYGEIGPRALGNRSILALASSQELARKVSMEHKGREWYRPVAPVMLEENAKYFTGEQNIHHLSKYMLLDLSILPEKIKEIEGVVHVDQTSRIQTIGKREENPFLFDLLSYLNEKGVKALINTSFNRKGEPITHTTEDAIKSARAMNLDAVVLNGELFKS